MNRKEIRQAQKLILSRRLELWLTPLLVLAPIIFAVVLFVESFGQGVLQGVTLYDGEFLLGCIILVGTLLFDIPFLRTVHFRRRQKKEND